VVIVRLHENCADFPDYSDFRGLTSPNVATNAELIEAGCSSYA